jgi:spore germination protein KB
MVKENISLTQLFVLIFNFLIGSSVVIGLGKEAMQNAWISILLMTFIGIGLMYLYYSINGLLPNKNLFEILEYCFSRPASILLTLGYVIYFLYAATRVIRTFGEMITTAILPNTPIEVISFSIVLVVAYILYLGLEVLARVSEIFTPYTVVFIILLVIFSLPNMQFYYLQPILGDGIKSIIRSMFPHMLLFPFGELIVFTIILTSVHKLEKGRKVSLIAVLTAGISLVIATILMIITLGVDVFEYSNFPMLSTARLVSIGHFLERIEIIVVFVMTLGVISKVSVYIYCGLKGMEYIFRLPYRYFTVPISLLVSSFSILIAVNYGDHLKTLKSPIIIYFYITMQLIIPIMTIIILKRKIKKNHSAQNGVKY